MTEWNTKDLQKLMNECIRREGVENNRRIEIEYAKHSWESYSGRAWVNSNWIKMIVPRPITKGWIDKEYRPKETIFDAEKFAKVFIHELGHNRGLRHEEMINWSEVDASWTKDFKVGLKDGLKIEKKDRTEIDKKVEEINKNIEKIIEEYNYWHKEYHEKNNVSPETNKMWDKWKEKGKLERMKQRIIESELKVVDAEPKQKTDWKKTRYEHALKMMKVKEQTLRRTQNILRKWQRKVRYYERVGLNQPL